MIVIQAKGRAGLGARRGRAADGHAPKKDPRGQDCRACKRVAREGLGQGLGLGRARSVKRPLWREASWCGGRDQDWLFHLVKVEQVELLPLR